MVDDLWVKRIAKERDMRRRRTLDALAVWQGFGRWIRVVDAMSIMYFDVVERVFRVIGVGRDGRQRRMISFDRHWGSRA